MEILEQILSLTRSGVQQVKTAADLLEEHFGSMLPRRQARGWLQVYTRDRLCCSRDYINTHDQIRLIEGRMLRACGDVRRILTRKEKELLLMRVFLSGITALTQFTPLLQP